MATNAPLDATIRQTILRFQKNEITEYHVYQRLAGYTDDLKNKQTLNKIADDEKRHAETWQRYTNQVVSPSGFHVFWYPLVARLLGLTFAVKLMERGEERAQHGYLKVIDRLPETKAIFADESRHERDLISILQEAKLSYLGSIVLGLNDALVELTGALAGLSFALQNTKLIALAGLVTGIAASMSMAASEYLSKKTENATDALKSAIYTGIAYIITVGLLVLPFLLLSSYQRALLFSLSIALLIIICFTFFSAVVQDIRFRRKFLEMAIITFGVATISFLISVGLKTLFGIDA